jgi:hypothetical protein
MDELVSINSHLKCQRTRQRVWSHAHDKPHCWVTGVARAIWAERRPLPRLIYPAHLALAVADCPPPIGPAGCWNPRTHVKTFHPLNVPVTRASPYYHRLKTRRAARTCTFTPPLCIHTLCFYLFVISRAYNTAGGWDAAAGNSIPPCATGSFLMLKTWTTDTENIMCVVTFR